MPLVDAYHRPINYLRISVTDRCNLRCIYCLPPEGVPWRPHSSILRYEEIETIVRAAATLGISQVRLTGGEPLVRQGIVELVERLADIPGITDLSMTTNGLLLPRYAKLLANAGLYRVNISLDTLEPERYRYITRGGKLKDTLSGIEAAHEAGLTPTKLNVVIIRGVNDNEVGAFAQKTRHEGWDVRFIELMPVGKGAIMDEKWHEQVVTAPAIRRKIEAELGPLELAKMQIGAGPARYYRLPRAKGTLGFITPISDHFCSRCNRLRLTADGQLRPCLLSDAEIDLRTPLRQGSDGTLLKELLQKAVATKPGRHRLRSCRGPEERAMSEIGG